MLRYWSSRLSIRSTADDTRTSLHVLSAAGFGKSYPFQGFLDASPADVATSYKESLQTILDNCMLLLVLGQSFLLKSWLPNKLHQATVTFKRYMTEVYEDEKQLIANGSPGNGNLMTSLVRASTGNASTTKNGKQVPNFDQDGLTESEIYGNVFF
jgi:hypothetical protein